jgi:hypothetical protein
MLKDLEKFVQTVHKRLLTFKLGGPSAAVLGALIETAYFASLKAEEGRYINGSLTYADPLQPDLSPPIIRRSDYPSFNRLGNRLPLTVEAFAKLARAVDSWSGSIVVGGTDQRELFIWGIADQLTQRNVRIHRESSEGFSPPGIVTVNIDGVGQLSAFHEDVFLGAINGQSVMFHEADALASLFVSGQVAPRLIPYADAIANALGEGASGSSSYVVGIFNSWTSVVARLCIGLKRFGTGGAFVITPDPRLDSLTVGHPFPYARLGDALILQVLDESHFYGLRDLIWEADRDDIEDIQNRLPDWLRAELSAAETDRDDRETELTGAVKLVSSLAALDGAVLLDSVLRVIGFATKIGNGPSVKKVFDGRDYGRRGPSARTIDLSGFGTRHLSMLRYCRMDGNAIGVVVSQDGQVRVVTTHKRHLLMWERVKLLGHDDYSPKAARNEIQFRARRAASQMRPRLGYSVMPKTVAQLMNGKGER